MLAAGLEEIPRLKEELRNADPQRRLKALPRLGDYCRAPGVIPALIEMLGDKDPVVRGFAASVLGSGEPSPQRRTPHWLIRGRLRGNADVIVPALLRLSNDPDEDVRWRVTLALGMMGAAGKRAVPYLLNVLKTETPKVRVGAIQALGHIGPVRDDIIPALLSVLKGPDLDFRARAATALGHMGPAARAAVKDLIAADAAAKLVSNRQGWNVRWAIMIALGQIGEPSSDTVPFLLEVIQQPVIGEDNATASFAARSLVEIGTPAAKAIPVLRRLSRAGDDSLKPTFRRCALTLEMAVWLAERGRSDDSPKRN
jgi:HEAT repeat protein